ncbi:MAG TPA: hypothetical protein VLC12_14660 [Terriglobales bacterium]|nr:hypothetical protein [Terriglobales bacterium]
MALRLISGGAGACALYLAIGPLLGGIPTLRPLWMHILLWTSALFLLAAAFTRAKGALLFAGVGSSLVIFSCAESWLAYALARMGYLHLHARLIAVQENWFDRWRLLLDRPVSAILIVLSLIVFLLSLRRWHQVHTAASASGDLDLKRPTCR